MYRVLNNKVLLLIVGILLLANISMFVFFIGKKESSKREYRGERRKSPVALFLEQDLQFAPQQMEEFEKLRQTHRQKMKPLFEDLRLAKVAFYGLLRDQNPNDSLIGEASSKVGEMQKAIEMQAFQNFREVRNLCRPEQRPRYDSVISGVIEKMWFPPRKGNGHQKENSDKEKR